MNVSFKKNERKKRGILPANLLVLSEFSDYSILKTGFGSGSTLLKSQNVNPNMNYR
jgi:hypothetical protein